MIQSRDEQHEYRNLIAVLQEAARVPREQKDEYLEAVETFLSYMKESPKTMLDKVREAKALKTRQELKEAVFHEALRYLDDLAARDEVSIDEYTFRSAVVGDLMRFFADNAIRRS